MSKMKQRIKKLLPRALYSPFLPLYHYGRGVMAYWKFGKPAKDLKVIGVTGTNGKTTTASYIASVLRASGAKVGLATTAQFMIGDEAWDNDLNVTVTNPYTVQKLMKRMKDAGVEWVVMEVTSHALVQHRVHGVPFHTAVMTNLSRDHLDYHGTMEKYAAAKAKLLKSARFEAVLNRDDEWYEYFAKASHQAQFTYGTNIECDVQLTKANLRADGSKIKFKYGNTEMTVDLHLPGKFNVYNAMAAAATGLGLELSPETVTKGLEDLLAVPGRMETIDEGQNFAVVVDYAHDGDAFRKVFESMKPLTRGSLIAVFGGEGERDPGRWTGMGEAAGELCDIVVLTDDEPLHEDPAKIRAAITESIKQGGQANVFEIPDREEAIAKAFKLAKPGDTVMLLALGHQKFRLVGDKRLPWDDREVARALLTNKPVKFPKMEAFVQPAGPTPTKASEEQGESQHPDDVDPEAAEVEPKAETKDVEAPEVTAEEPGSTDEEAPKESEKTKGKDKKNT